jgi:hypothetical protein
VNLLQVINVIPNERKQVIDNGGADLGSLLEPTVLAFATPGRK